LTTLGVDGDLVFSLSDVLLARLVRSLLPHQLQEDSQSRSAICHHRFTHLIACHLIYWVKVSFRKWSLRRARGNWHSGRVGSN